MSQSQNINSEVNLGLPVTAPDEIQHPEVIILYRQFIKTANILLRALEQYVGVTQQSPEQWNVVSPIETILRSLAGRFYCQFSEAVSYGDFVNIHNVAGIANARKASATSGSVKPAHGYCNIINGVALGAFGEVILSQGIFQLVGILPGQAFYLSETTPGLATVTAPVGAGQLEQFLGIGIRANIAYIDITLGQYIQH